MSKEEFVRALERGRQAHAEYLARMRAKYGDPLPLWVPIS